MLITGCTICGEASGTVVTTADTVEPSTSDVNVVDDALLFWTCAAVAEGLLTLLIIEEAEDKTLTAT